MFPQNGPEIRKTSSWLLGPEHSFDDGDRKPNEDTKDYLGKTFGQADTNPLFFDPSSGFSFQLCFVPRAPFRDGRSLQ